jgi:predicted ATPase/DNA-binding CsgD family transcriptional regulator
VASLLWPRQRGQGLSKRAVDVLSLLAEGMSDREIAEHLVMSINTVKWYNHEIYLILGVGSRMQAVARACELHLLDSDHVDIRRGTISAFQSPRSTPKQNLPTETTHFIGRAPNIKAIKRLLDAAHLLTLVGPPGTGKTRLALQLARSTAATYPEGAYFVSLAPISDPALVTNAIASALGVHGAHGQPLLETLKQALNDSRMLLILDNCEHLLAGMPQVAELLAAAPHLKLLATSREPLHLYGEQEYLVPPLKLPDLEHLDPEHPDLAAIAECESVALFLQRARAAHAGFELAAANALEIANICIRLDGLPLAIELAAARTKLLTPHALLARLSNRLDTLTGGASDLSTRQQTLRNTIAWSYHLLTHDEQRLFVRLAVFHGGCSLEAIEVVCGAGLSIDVLDGLESLVNKNLVQRRALPGGELRFDMLETLREYASERFNKSAEAATLCRRHAQFFVQLAERAEPEFRQARQWYWFRLLDIEHDNLRAVLTWSLQDDADAGDGEGDGESAHAESGHRTPTTLGVRLAGALCHFWFVNGFHAEGRAWAQQLLDHLESVPPVPIQYRAKLFITAGSLSVQHDLDAAQCYFDRALHVSRALGDSLTTAWALTFKGFAMLREMEAAVATVEEGLELFRALHHLPGIAQALCIVGTLALIRGDDAHAHQAYEECLAVSQTTGETRRVYMMFRHLATVARHAGEYDRSRALAEQSVQLALETNSKLGIREGLSELAAVLGITGQPERAARLMGAWKAALERMGAACDPVETLEYHRTIAAIRAQLDARTFAAAWTVGSALSLEQAVALVHDGGNA